jgi:hypothetical protein
MDMKLPSVLTDGDLDRALEACLEQDRPRDLAARVMATIASGGPARRRSAVWPWALALPAGATAVVALFIAIGSHATVDRPALPASPVLVTERAVAIPPAMEPSDATLRSPSRSSRRARLRPPDERQPVPVLAALDAPEPIVVARLDTSPIERDHVAIAPLKMEPLHVESLDAQ